MRRLLLTGALLLASLNLFAAEPRIGDFATYDLTANGVQATMKVELTNISGNGYTKVTTMTFNGQSQVTTDVVPRDELSSSEELTAVMNMCEDARVGGRLETVNVPACVFNTCSLANPQGGSANIGVVPFGLVKFNSAEATLELTGYGYGNKK